MISKYMLIFILCFPLIMFSQPVINSFESEPDDPNFWIHEISTNANSTYAYSDEIYITDLVKAGTGSMKINWGVHNVESWGGYSHIRHLNPDDVYDFSGYDSISFWYYNDIASSLTGRVNFRLILYDVSNSPQGNNTSDINQMEIFYSFHYILDNAAGWNRINIPLLNDHNAWSGEAFNRTGWAGIEGNDILNRDKIKGYCFEFSISGAGEGDQASGSIILDHLTLSGEDTSEISKYNHLIFFSGTDIDPVKHLYTWDSFIKITKNAGSLPENNALEWHQMTSYQWCGLIFYFNPYFDMSDIWMNSSIKFKINAPTGTGTLRIQFVDSSGNAIKYLCNEAEGGYNDQWNSCSISLRDIITFESGSSFDTSLVVEFQIMTEGEGNGYTILFDEIWIGNPKFDESPPEMPSNLNLSVLDYLNRVNWQDVPNEDNEFYTIYYSEKPITDIHDTDVYVSYMGSCVPEDLEYKDHLLFSTIDSEEVSYYYAITCEDISNNESSPTILSDFFTNYSKKINPISRKILSNFIADGNLNEWNEIQPFKISISEGSSVEKGIIDNDIDLLGLAYLSMDDTYLYFAFDINDDIIDEVGEKTWQQDSPELFIGLYNWNGEASHQYYYRGSQPDYNFRFNKTQIIANHIGQDYIVIDNSSPNYYWGEKSGNGYKVEGCLTWSEIASITNDTMFYPVDGYCIPFDFMINDADGGVDREGLLCFSPNNNDYSWASPEHWIYTWINWKDTTVSAFTSWKQSYPPKEFLLAKNYPNPFNPSTVISYQLPVYSKVELSIYNLLGQKVRTLVNCMEQPGHKSVVWDGRNEAGEQLSSGMYIYRLEAEGFVQIRKMILLR